MSGRGVHEPHVPELAPSLKWETLRVDRPKIHYARSSGNVYVGYQAFGSGPFDLVVVPGALSNID